MIHRTASLDIDAGVSSSMMSHPLQIPDVLEDLINILQQNYLNDCPQCAGSGKGVGKNICPFCKGRGKSKV
jgi:hypothetical protein